MLLRWFALKDALSGLLYHQIVTHNPKKPINKIEELLKG